MRINRVGLKLSFLASIFVLLVIGAMGRLAFRNIEAALRSEMEVRANFFARSLKEVLVTQVDPFALHFQVNQMLNEKAVVYAIVQDTHGKFLSNSLEPGKIQELDTSEVGRKALESQQGIAQSYRDQKGKEFFDIAVPICKELRPGAACPRELRLGTARLGFTRDSIERALAKAREQVFLIGAAAIGVLVLTMIGVVGWMMRPLSVLAQAAEQVRQGRLDVLVKPQSKDEIGTLACSFNAMVQGLKERELIRDTFGKYVNPQVAQAALKGELRLGGERRRISVLMSDIRDFTQMSEKLPPEQVVAILNIYLSRMVKIVMANEGRVDKFIGDAIFAIFGAPLAVEDHAAKAARAALAMRQELERMNSESQARGGGTLRMGIAITSGEAVAGNIGSPEKMEYTVIGDTVNLASRLEGLNKRFGTDIIVASETYRLLQGKDFQFKPFGSVEIRGRKEAVEVYALI